MKKVNWTNNTDVRLGFEIECVLHNRCYRTFCRRVRALHPKMIIGQDWSINTVGCGYYDGHTCEVKTPPLPPKDAINLLKQLFDLVNAYGFTNASCGFHVNISSAKKSKMKNFNPMPFLSSKLWNEILKKFKRESNTYCKAMLRLKDRRLSRVSMLKNMTNTLKDKYWCVNLSNFRDNHPNSRIEIRAFGNKHYTQKFDLIASYIKRIERLFKLSCDAGKLFTRTFAV
jgi:hypothetical protein